MGKMTEADDIQEYCPGDQNSRQKLADLQKEAATHIDLAWVYASATHKGIQDKNKALDHAKKAALITKGCDAFILNTLGWVYFLNDRVEEAIGAAEDALELCPENKHFKKQLEIYNKSVVKSP